MNKLADAIILTCNDIRRLATAVDYFTAVSEAFRSHAGGSVRSPLPMEIEAVDGAFHAKGASMLVAGRPLAILKLNGNFPGNGARFGLPTIQGAALLCDSETGALLAILDSSELTLRRTAAASAVALNALALKSAESLLVCGAGVQGAAHIEALAHLRPFKVIRFFDIDGRKARDLASRLSEDLGLDIRAAGDLTDAARQSDVIVTCTPSATPIIFEKDVRPGALIVAVGADNPHKNEIAPTLMRRAAVIADVAAQCVIMGDTRAAIAEGALDAGSVRAELGDVLTGARPGRLSEEEIIIFDSTGAAFEDLAAAAMLAERAREVKIGVRVRLAA